MKKANLIGRAAVGAFLAAVSLAACAPKPIRVGFIGPMTGPSANIGTEGLKGFAMAIEEANIAGSRGAIRGARIEVRSADDEGKPDRCRETALAMIKEGINLIVLHTTSGAGAGALALMETEDVLFLTRTVSDPAWVDKDDRFLRFVGSTDAFGQAMGSFAADQGCASIAAIVDRRNSAYARSMLGGFLQKAGNPKVLGTREVDVGFSHAETAAWAAALTPCAIFAILSGLDAAKLAQELDRVGYTGSLYLSPWSQDQNLLSYSGRSSDRIFLPSSFDPHDPSAVYVEFQNNYQRLFSDAPTMAGVFGYEMGRFLVEGLRTASKRTPVSVKKALSEIRGFQGLQYSFELDAEGDASMEALIIGIQNGAFSRVDREKKETK